MTNEEARAVIVAVLERIAPEIDAATIDPSAELGTELDLDSMDFLNLVEGVATETSCAIPERDYPHIMTLESFAEYLVKEKSST